MFGLRQDKKKEFFWCRFNNINCHFPAIYLSSCEGRHTPENVISKFVFSTQFIFLVFKWIFLGDASIVTSKTQQSDDSDWVW
jgi:hypothetical protein